MRALSPQSGRFVMRLIATLALAAAAALTSAAQAEDITVKLGVLNDMSSLYADIGGQGSVLAAKMAIADFDPAAHGMKVELISADHLNKPDVGANIAKQWIDVDHVDAILDVPTSSVALAVNEVVREKNKVFLVSGAAISDLTGTKCSPNTVHWTYDTWMLAHGTAGALVKTGGDTWFFLTSDYAFGHALERDATAVVLANAGGDTDNAIKQGAEFGIAAGGQQFAGLLVFITDVQSLGLKVAQGLVLTESWYWDMTDANRAWTKRWQVERPGKFPAMTVAGVYASTLHYLKAVAALKSATDGKAVVAKMKDMPTDDPLFGKGYIRADGRKIHPAYLFEVKKPSESKYPGDDYKVRATIPAAEAFRPLKDGGCPLVSN